MKIPKDLDELMWQLVESGDGTAIEGFKARFPRLAEELDRRLEAVQDLRAVGANVTAKKQIPKFEPKHPPVVASTWKLYTALGVGAVLIVVTSVMVLQSLNQPKATLLTTNINPAPILTPFPTAPPTAGAPPASNSGGGSQAGPLEPALPSPEVTAPQVSQTVSALDTVITFRVEKATIQDTITLILGQANLRPIFAPGLRDAVITASYENTTPRKVLSAMGQQIGFEVIDQRDGTVVIRPAPVGTDPNIAEEPIPPPRVLPDIR